MSSAVSQVGRTRYTSLIDSATVESEAAPGPKRRRRLQGAKGIDVIIDEGVWLKEHRDLLRKRAEDVGAQAVVYFLDTPIETIRERVARRNMNAAQDSFKISGDLLDVYLQYWEPPSEDEGYLLASEAR
jgi:predicted kinase